MDDNLQASASLVERFLPDHARILISCVDDGTGAGGLYSYDGRQVSQLDKADTMSVIVTRDAVVRLLWSHREVDPSLVIYSYWGAKSMPLEGHWNAHQLGTWNDEILLVSTQHNAIVAITSSMSKVVRWSFCDVRDAWHINCITSAGGALYASAFGRFSTSRGWKTKMKGAGFVFDVQSGRQIVDGLYAPHDPRLLPEGWLICNSGDHSLLLLDFRTSKQLRRIALNGWTRGIVVTDENIFVGVSSPKHEESLRSKCSWITVLCRERFQEVDRVLLDAREIRHLQLVSKKHIQMIVGCRVP